MSPEPVLLHPILDPKPWGGRRLETCGIDLADRDLIGEALLTAPDAIVASGPFAGESLSALARGAPDVWVGARGLEATAGRTVFPLLVKLIDANTDLSIQVHPDDVAAAAANLSTGKTEAWHVLAAHPGSVLYLGLLPNAGVELFTRSCLQGDGEAASYLRRIPAEAGTTIVVPAGTPHAIGAGCLIYEIQQPSNVTFRLDDWGRVDSSGQPRALHHDDGFAALSPESRPSPIPRVTVSTSPKRELLAATRYFALERIALDPIERTVLGSVDSPQVLYCLAGEASLTSEGWRGTVASGETMVAPVAFNGTLSTSQSSVVLRGWVPDLEMDVIRPATASGASAAAIERFGISTGIA